MDLIQINSTMKIYVISISIILSKTAILHFTHCHIDNNFPNENDISDLVAFFLVRSGIIHYYAIILTVSVNRLQP